MTKLLRLDPWKNPLWLWLKGSLWMLYRKMSVKVGLKAEDFLFVCVRISWALF